MQNLFHKPSYIITLNLLTVILLLLLLKPMKADLLQITNKNIINNQVSQTCNFGSITNLYNNKTNYYVARQYFQISYLQSSSYTNGYGMQLYTQNSNYKEPGLRGGLVDTAFSNRIPLYWQVYNKTNNIKMTNQKNWNMIKDKTDGDWVKVNYTKNVSLFYSNQLAPYPPNANRSLPAAQTNLASVYLYLGVGLNEKIICNTNGRKYSTTLWFDLYYLTPVPTISSISPTNGARGKTVNLTIHGWNFITNENSISVELQNGQNTIIPAPIKVRINTITCSLNLTNAVIGTWKLVVISSNRSNGQKSTSSPVDFSVNPSLTITSINPNKGNNNEIVNNITIKGTGFCQNTTIKMQSIKDGQCICYSVQFCCLDAQTISCGFDLSKLNRIGKYNVILINPDKTQVALNDAFTVQGYELSGDMLLPVNNFFNPHNGEKVSFKWSLSKQRDVTITIVNIKGEIVKTIVNNQSEDPGVYQMDWAGDNNGNQRLASGVYFVRINAGSFQDQHKILLVK